MPDQAEAVDLQGKYKSEHADGPKERVKRAKESKRRTILPKPRALSVTADVYFEWGASFNEEQNGRAVFHMYREHPVINLLQIGEQKPKLIALNWVPQGSPYTSAKFPFPADMWQEYILTNKQWGGSGSYKLMCTEMGVPGCVCMTKFILEDADYPPCVDPRALDVGHPSNKGYIQSLRAQGIKIPGDNPVQEKIDQEEEEEMNVAGLALAELGKANERQAARIEELEDRHQQTEPTAAPDAVAGATVEAIKVIGEGARMGMGLVADQARDVAKASAPSFDPVALFRIGMEARGNDSGMLQLFIASQERSLAAMQTMQKEAFEFMREQAEERESTAVALVPKKQGVELLLEEGAKFKQLGELLGWSTGGRRSSREQEPVQEAPKPNSFEKFFDKMTENPAMLITGLALLTNLVQSVMGKGKSPEEVIKDSAQITSALNGKAKPEETALPTEKERFERFMSLIQPIFLMNYFDEEQQGLSGYTFAADFLSMTENGPGSVTFVPNAPESPLGRSQYDQLKQSGAVYFDRMVRNFHPIWSMIQGNMGKYSMFLKEFFAYDEEAARLAEQKKQTQ